MAGTVSVPVLTREVSHVHHMARATIARRLSTIAGLHNKYAVEEVLPDHSPAVAVRRPRIDYGSRATGLDRPDGSRGDLAAICCRKPSDGMQPDVSDGASISGSAGRIPGLRPADKKARTALKERWVNVTSEEEFVEFAEASSARLRRTAFLFCGDWHTAEDLVQTALTKVFLSWRTIRRRDAVQAYATRTLVNAYLADRRLKRPRELLTGALPERPAESPESETRIVVLDALASLPPRGRAVVVLRYWADLSVEQVAAVLGCSAGNVKSQSARALDKLRPALRDAISDADVCKRPPGSHGNSRDTGHG